MSVNETIITDSDIDYKISRINTLISANEDQLCRLISVMERLKHTLRNLAENKQHTR